MARSLEEEKVVQERMLAELREQLRQLRAAGQDHHGQPTQREDEVHSFPFICFPYNYWVGQCVLPALLVMLTFLGF